MKSAPVPCLTQIIFAGAIVKVYLDERNKKNTSYAACVATGMFNANNQPILKPVPPKKVSKFDFYLGDSRVAFETQIHPRHIVSRPIN
ncbi:hypothetical protein [Runella salmonicolor]|uniref:Uncharacterized protein n=1 Tax=Runella salmonicolor TaxID=2950278 RepID=A0ABT1FT18_9BACT|nr:hypothetical protein [Runella salmonicolor]MCP1384866.1 hypothetical protein [Runella salmonicolor]